MPRRFRVSFIGIKARPATMLRPLIDTLIRAVFSHAVRPNGLGTPSGWLKANCGSNGALSRSPIGCTRRSVLGFLMSGSINICARIDWPVETGISNCVVVWVCVAPDDRRRIKAKLPSVFRSINAPPCAPFRMDLSTYLGSVTVYPGCGGHLSLIAALTDPASLRRYLQGVDLPTEPPLLTPPRPPTE